MTITEEPVTNKSRVVGTVLLWLLLIPGFLWTVVRLGGWERGPLIQLLAFTPYVAVGVWVPALLGLILRRWAPAAVATVIAVGLAACVLPRVLPDGNRGADDGVKITVMTSNLLFGGADPAEVVRLVRENDVAVLAVQEFTQPGQDALRTAGLDTLLPYHQLAPEPGASGTGLYSRYPLVDPGAKRNDGGFQQTWGTVQIAGAAPFFIESVHPLAPSAPDTFDGWRTDLGNEPKSDGDNPHRILLGDFNATLDHGPLRDLIAHGYHDAADTVGKGLIATWGPYDGDPIPPVTIDHVLVDEQIGVRDVSVHDVKRSDHRAVIAELTLPAAS